jgi:ATP synthase protein I
MRGKDELPKANDQSQRSAKSDGIDQGMRVLSYLISGVLVYGALGWVGDHFLHTHFLLPIGIVLGAAGGVYVIIKRYGQLGNDTTTEKKP